jgi:CBS domain containing-hemolysin-like protein
MSEVLLLGLSLVLVLACGIFVAAEFSLIAVNRSTAERLAAKGDNRAKGIVKALTTLSTQLSSAQVGITITNLAIGLLAQPAIAQLIDGPLENMGLPSASVPGIAIVIGIALATIVTMIFGELIPKNIAIAKPMTTAKLIQRPLLLFTSIMRWPIYVLNTSANHILRLVFKVEPQEELASARSADELLSLVRRSAEKGTLEKETALILERSLNFGDLTALDVMTPRVRMRALQANAMASEVIKLTRSTGLSRFPVYDKTLDEIVGIVHVKQVLGLAVEKRSTTSLRKIMRRPVLVPSTIQLEPLLEALKRGGLQMAVVIDEFGGTDGVVTMEDLIEELVGEVHDEHDPTKSTFRKRADGSWLLSGLLRPDEIGEELGIFLPEEDEVETIAGLVTHFLERIPRTGDTARIKAIDRDGTTITAELRVERMDGHRIDRIRMITTTGKASKERQR